MEWKSWSVLAGGVILGGWLAFDGVRALVVGDYVTPRSGTYAGQLGPWSRVAAAVGVNPRGTPMKCVHVMLGLSWLAACGALLAGAGRAPSALLACSVASLWYLPFGTVIGVVELALLWLMRGKGGA